MPLTFKKNNISIIKREEPQWKQVFETDDDCALWTLNLELSKSDIDSLWEAELVEKPATIVMGKPCKMRRNIGFFSDESKGYRYTNQISKAKPLTDVMKRLLLRVNSLCGETFNGLLFNLYVDGNDCIGAHRDNESNLSPVGVVALSLGAGRKFRVRSYPSGQILYDHITGNGELMWMKGRYFHQKLTHEVPVEKKIREPRLSITFRKHLS